MEIIHIVLGKANPDRLNGVNKVVYQMATEQARAGKNVRVWGITPNPVHNYPDRAFQTSLFKAEKFPFAVDKALKAAIVANKQAVFHLHGGWIPVFSTLARWFKRHRIKYVFTPHGAYNEVAMQRSYWRKRLYFHLFEKTLLRHVQKVHAIGRSEVSGLSKLYPQAAAFLLPYGFDADTQTGAGPEDPTFTVGFVGRLDVHTKGLDLLMEAFYRFQKIHPDSRLWIIGDGEGKGWLENFIATHQLHNAVLWGPKFGQEKDDLIRKMHVFAHPSRNEGLPTAVLEAASKGVPTIVTEATNMAEYVTQYQSGIAIADEQVPALEKAMLQLHEAYEHGTAARYASGARQMLQSLFSWPVLVEKYDALYQ